MAGKPYNSNSAPGTQAAPAAGTAIVTLTAPGDGYFRAEITTFQVGTVDTNRTNMALYLGSAKLCDLLSTALVTKKRLRFRLPASTDVVIKSGASVAGAGSVYVADISLEQVTGSIGRD